MCRANPDCDEDGIEVNTTIWFNGDGDAGSLDLAGLDDTGFQLVCPACNADLHDDDLHTEAKARIEEFAERNGASLSHSPQVIYEVDVLLAEISKRFEDEENRQKFEAIVTALQAEQHSNTDDKDASA